MQNASIWLNAHVTHHSGRLIIQCRQHIGQQSVLVVGAFAQCQHPVTKQTQELKANLQG